MSRGAGGASDDNPRQFIADVNPTDESKLNFLLINAEWKIIYPPFPRVGVKALINLYEEDLERLKKITGPSSMPQFQKKSYEYEKPELDFLKKLAAKSL